MDIVFVGAGRLATNMARALQERGHRIVAVYSRTPESAQALSSIVGGKATHQLGALPLLADAYLVAVKDVVLSALLPELAKGRVGCPVFHTAGSMPLSVFEGSGFQHYGVVYPMQTFSKERQVDFSTIPIFIEGSSDRASRVATELATSLSGKTYPLSSEKRRYLHLAAVFACNFANHCMALSADVLAHIGIPFDVMMPLVDQTVRKLHSIPPAEAQTGPAVRYDENVIRRQHDLLADNPEMQRIYDLLTESIHKKTMNND
jgi:predicted short-subunit dehydrogenase-like oxidoreductase (DUF2520 family)